MVHIFLKEGRGNVDLPHMGSILDSQLSRESGKFQLARWSRKVVIFSDRTTRPATRPTIWMSDWLESWNWMGVTFFQCCAVSPPVVCSIDKVCAVSPPTRICFSPPQMWMLD